MIHEQWDDAADTARLPELERRQLGRRQVLNPYTGYGYPTGV